MEERGEAGGAGSEGRPDGGGQELAARIAEVLGVPIQALLPTERGGGSGQRGERTISILTALLHYHESVEAAIAGEAPAAGPVDEYAEALREAIRCVEEVHKA